MSNPFASRSSVRASKRSLHRAKAKLACGLFMLGQTMLPAALAEQATFTPPTPIEVSGTVPLSNNSPVVPESVMAGLTGAVTNTGTNVIDFGSLSSGHLNFGNNNFANDGILYAISTNPAIQTAQISANSIFNSGLITTIIPSGGLPGYESASLVQGLNLTLTAIQNIVNSGAITSAGSLNVTGAAIFNALPTTAQSLPAPVMSAVQSLNLQTNSIVNSGTLVSQLANINILTNLPGNLAINSLGGTFQALSGNINIGETIGQTVLQNLNINGGKFLSEQLNIASDNGNAILNTQALTGVLNISGGEAHVLSSGDLTIGQLVLTNDPSFETDGEGNIILTGDIGATDEITGNIFIHSANSIYNMGATSIAAPGQGLINITATNDIVLDGLALMSTNGGQIRVKAENGNLSWQQGGNINSGGGAVFLEAEQNIVLNGLQGINTDGGSLSLESTSAGISWSNENSTASVTTGKAMTSFIALGDITATNLSINTSGADGGKTGVLSKEGSVDLSGTTIRSTDSPLTFAGPRPTSSPSSVLLAAKHDLIVGNILSPAGSVNIAAGAEIFENPSFPGDLFVAHSQFVGDLTTGNINIDSAASPARGMIIADTGLGNVSVGALNGNGSRVWIRTNGGDITVGSISDASRLADTEKSGFVYPHVEVVVRTLEGNVQIQDSMDVTGGNAVVESQIKGSVTINGQITAREAFSNPGFLFIRSDGVTKFSGSSSIDAVSSDSSRGLNRVTVIGDSVEFDGPFLIDAHGIGNAQGGVIRVTSTATIGNSGILTLNANGGGTGDGGGVEVFTGTDLDMSASGAIRASARGGENGGGGGSAFFSSNGHLQISKSTFDVSPAGDAGKGGSIRLESKTLQIVNNTLSADGKGVGDGGSIFIAVTSPDQPLSFSNGSDMPKLFARSGEDGGNGGSITVQAGGDLRADSTHIHTESRGGENGNGGSIFLQAGRTQTFESKGGQTQAGALTINGNLTANGKGTGFGGTIALHAYGEPTSDGGPIGGFAALVPGPSATSPGSVQINGNLTANGGDQSDGGRVEIHAETIGSLDGQVLPNQASIKLGDETKDYSIRANGGVSGGTVDIYSNGNIALNANSVSANATENGTGGSIRIKLDPSPVADDGGVIIGAFAANFTPEAGAESATVANAAFYANGAGVGSGGFVKIEAADGSVIINTPSTVAVSVNSGVALANNSGTGGTIQLISGKNLLVTGSLQAKGAAGGGTISSLAASDLTISGSVIDANASSAGTGDGGQITLESVSGNVRANSAIKVDGGLSGKGGSIIVNATHGSITLGSELKSVSISAVGGIETGNGGEVSVQASNSIDLFTNYIAAESRGENGNGGDISIKSASGDIFIAGNVNASAKSKNGDGGDISITTAGDFITIDGNVDFSSYGVGNGGSLKTDPTKAINFNGHILGFALAQGHDGGYWEDIQDGDINLKDVNLFSALGNGGYLKLESRMGSVKVAGQINTWGLKDGGFVGVTAAKSISVGGEIQTYNRGASDSAEPGVAAYRGGGVALKAGESIQTKGINSSSVGGAAGSIFIQLNSTDPFVIGAASSSGIHGDVNISGHTAAPRLSDNNIGESTYFYVENQGIGGVILKGDNVVRSTTATSLPPVIALVAKQGTVTIVKELRTEGTLDNSGGNIALIANMIDIKGANVFALGGSKGGLIYLSANKINAGNNSIIAATGTMGGSIRLTPKVGLDVGLTDRTSQNMVPKVDITLAEDVAGDITFSGSGLTTIQANGTNGGGAIIVKGIGANFSSTGNANLLFQASAVSNGPGGQIDLAVPELIQGSTVKISLNANAAGSNSGGRINLTAQTTLAIGLGAGQLSVSANGGESLGPFVEGKQNNVSISSGDLNLFASGISMVASNEHKGGTLKINSKGTLILKGDLFVKGADNQSGGNIEITADSIKLDHAAIETQSSGTGASNGKINLNAVSGDIITIAGNGKIRTGELSLTSFKSTAEVPFSLLPTAIGNYGEPIFSNAQKLVVNMASGDAYIEQSGSVDLTGTSVNGYYSVVVRPFNYGSSVDKGNIVGTGIIASHLSIESQQGNIGTGNSPLIIGANDAIFQAKGGTDQVVNMRFIDYQKPDGSGTVFSTTRVGGAIDNGHRSVSSGRIILQGLEVSLEIAPILAKHGSIDISSNRNITLDSGFSNLITTVRAEGSVSLNAGAKINFKNGVSVVGNSGIVTVLAGNGNGSAVHDAPQTPGVEIQEINDGVIQFGLNGIGVISGGNVLRASGQGLITLDGGDDASNIVLEGNVRISSLIPISYIQNRVRTPAGTFRIVTSKGRSINLMHSDNFCGTLESSKLVVKSGSCIVRAINALEVSTGGLIAELTKNSLVEVDGNSVRNLHGNSIFIKIGNHRKFKLSPGQEVSFGNAPKGNVGRRNTTVFDLSSIKVHISDFSIPSALIRDPLLSALRWSDVPAHKVVTSNIMKTASALTLVTSKRGAYSN